MQHGVLHHPKIRLHLAGKLGHGRLTHVNAIVLHQTDSETSEPVFSQYDHKGSTGAHFLIDKDGTIYQTLPVTQIAWHVGNIRSRCLETHTCSPDESKFMNAMEQKEKGRYREYVRLLSKHESAKPYPSRYPSNHDSIGIEVVGKMSDKRSGTFEHPTAAQNNAVKWLVSHLLETLHLKRGDVYRHPQVSYKSAGEAADVKW